MARGIPKAVPKRPGPYHARQPTKVHDALANNAKTPPPKTSYTPRPSAMRAPPSAAPLNIPRSGQPKFEQRRGVARSIGMYGMAAAALGLGFYGTQVFISYKRTSEGIVDHSPAVQKDVSGVYDQTAQGFDTEVNFSEWMGGINKARKQMADMAQGHVLEVSAGTARNLAYYKFGKMKSLTLIDLSEQMVEQSRKKWDIFNPGKVFDNVPVRFMQGDCTTEMPAPPIDTTSGSGSKKGYDTIVQTMGLCSIAAPVQLLKNLSNHLDHTNPDARILLLEHGRSYYAWLNEILDTHAPQHADKHGCWWNRDIGQIVEESGLEIVEERRKHVGTTWIYELKPKAIVNGSKQEQQVQASAPAQKGWLSFLSN